MPTYTLGDIQNRVFDRLDNALLYTLAEITYEINSAISVLNLYCGMMNTTVSIPGASVIGRHLYQFPAGILFPTSVYFKGRQLRPVSLRQLALRYRTWATDTTTGKHPVQEWAPIGITQFVIHPADSIGGNDISVRGIAEPVPLVNPTDTVTVEDDDIQIIEDLAASTITIKEGGKIAQDAGKVYMKFLHDMRRKTRWERVRFPKYFVKTYATETNYEQPVEK